MNTAYHNDPVSDPLQRLSAKRQGNGCRIGARTGRTQWIRPARHRCPDRFVAVLVELKRGLASGRHAKCWKRLAEATADCAELDVTVYVFGDRLSVDPIGPLAHFVAPPPVLGTGRLSGTFGAVDPRIWRPVTPGWPAGCARTTCGASHTASPSLARRCVGRPSSACRCSPPCTPTSRHWQERMSVSCLTACQSLCGARWPH